MSFEKSINFEQHKFKFDVDTYVFVKGKTEIQEINRRLKEESPESDYESYSWYLIDEKIEKLKYKKVKVVSQISWHGGLPYYVIELKNGQRYNVGEFYCQSSFKYEIDSEGLILHKTFKNIPEEEGTRIKRVPIKLAGFDAAYEETQTFGSGYHSVIFLYEDVRNMSDEKIEKLARNFPEADLHDSLSIRRREKYGVVYVSFSFHRISRIPGTEKW